MRKVGMGANDNSADLAAENAELKKANADLAAEKAELKEALKALEQKNKAGTGRKKGAVTEDPGEQDTDEPGVEAEK